MSDFCQCSTCGYEWRRRTHSGHSCAEHLQKQISELKKDLLTCLSWIDDGDDQEGKDLIVGPIRAKYQFDLSITT